MKCIRGNKVEVLRSQAGWYFGTRDRTGSSRCRVSDYYKERPETLDCPRVCAENEFCNKNQGCNIK